MTMLGFRVKEMLGGFDWWKRNGQRVETGSIAPACAVSGMHEARSESCGC